MPLVRGFSRGNIRNVGLNVFEAIPIIVASE
jgi:hypothetical protein